MRLRRTVLSAVLCSVSSLSAIGGEPASRPAIDIGELEAHIVAARRQVTSGEFRIAATPTAPLYRRQSYHIWFDGSTNVRQEVQIDDQVNVSILTDKAGIYYGGRPGDHENPDLIKRSALYMFPAAEAPPIMFCDPRVAMMVPLQVGLWCRYHPDWLVTQPGRANVAAKASAWNGLESIIVSFEDPRFGNTYEYEAVPARSYNIVRWRLAGTIRGRTAPIRFEDTFECDLIEAKKGLWFPHQIRRIEKRDWKTKTDEMTAIDPVGVNGTIEASRFTLAGGQLPAKQLIVQSLPQGFEPTTKPAGPAPAARERLPLLWWDGKDVRPLTPADEAEREKSKSTADSSAVSRD